MTARTHDIVAFASLLTAAALFPPDKLNIPTLFTCLVANIVGALIPDMDQATNRLWDLLPAGNAVGRVFRKFMLSHRTVSHSLLGIYLLYRILLFVFPLFFNENIINTRLVIFSIMIGFSSHLLADSATKEGIPLFFPLKFKIGFPPLSRLRITTGKFIENFLVFPAVLGYIFWLTYNKREIFLSIVKLIKY